MAQQFRESRQFREQVLKADGYKCQNIHCKTRDKAVFAHHIVFRSQAKNNSVTNGITLCQECHQKVHEGGWAVINGQRRRLTGRQFMLTIVLPHTTDPDYRWKEVVATLIRREKNV